MENSKPNYYANIPADVRYCENLTANAKLLYGEITALCNKEGFCWASNKYFAKLYKVSETSVSLWVKSLKENDFIDCELKDNYRRKIYLKGVLRKLKGGIKKTQRGVLRKLKDNNKDNTKEREKEKAPLSQPSPEEISNKLDKIANNYHREISEIITSGKTVITPQIRRVLLSALQNFSPLHLLLAIKGFTSEKDQWQMKNNGHKGLEWFFKSSERLSGYIGLFNKNIDENVKDKYIKDAKNYLLS